MAFEINDLEMKFLKYLNDHDKETFWLNENIDIVKLNQDGTGKLFLRNRHTQDIDPFKKLDFAEFAAHNNIGSYMIDGLIDMVDGVKERPQGEPPEKSETKLLDPEHKPEKGIDLTRPENNPLIPTDDPDPEPDPLTKIENNPLIPGND